AQDAAKEERLDHLRHVVSDEERVGEARGTEQRRLHRLAHKPQRPAQERGDENGQTLARQTRAGRGRELSRPQSRGRRGGRHVCTVTKCRAAVRPTRRREAGEKQEKTSADRPRPAPEKFSPFFRFFPCFCPRFASTMPP